MASTGSTVWVERLKTTDARLTAAQKEVAALRCDVVRLRILASLDGAAHALSAEALEALPPALRPRAARQSRDVLDLLTEKSEDALADGNAVRAFEALVRNVLAAFRRCYGL